MAVKYICDRCNAEVRSIEELHVCELSPLKVQRSTSDREKHVRKELCDR